MRAFQLLRAFQLRAFGMVALAGTAVPVPPLPGTFAPSELQSVATLTYPRINAATVALESRQSLTRPYRAWLAVGRTRQLVDNGAPIVDAGVPVVEGATTLVVSGHLRTIPGT